MSSPSLDITLTPMMPSEELRLGSATSHHTPATADPDSSSGCVVSDPLFAVAENIAVVTDESLSDDGRPVGDVCPKLEVCSSPGMSGTMATAGLQEIFDGPPGSLAHSGTVVIGLAWLNVGVMDAEIPGEDADEVAVVFGP